MSRITCDVCQGTGEAEDYSECENCSGFGTIEDDDEEE